MSPTSLSNAWVPDRSEWLRVRSLPLEKVEVAVPFVLFGPTGVFILQASRGYWLDTDIDLMTRAAGALGRAIREYPDLSGRAS